MFAAEEPPDGWIPCDGRLLSREEEDHSALFSLIGTTYGGDGKTTFGVPDLRDRVPIGESAGRPRGVPGGDAEHTLGLHELPPHTHEVFGEDVSPSSAGGEQPGPERVICNSAPVPLYAPAENLRPMLDGVIRAAGGSAPHVNEQPFLALAFFIAFKGLWPPRDGGAEEGRA